MYEYLQITLHDDFEDFVEFICGKALDVLGAGVEVASEVGEDGKMSIDRGSVPFEDFKIGLVGR